MVLNKLSRLISAATVTALSLTALGATAASAALPAPSGVSGPYTATDIQVEVAGGEAARGSIAILPDTQFYSRYGVADSNLFGNQYGDIPGPFESQTRWIADNAATHNIVMTQHLGDMVDQDRANQQY